MLVFSFKRKYALPAFGKMIAESSQPSLCSCKPSRSFLLVMRADASLIAFLFCFGCRSGRNFSDMNQGESSLTIQVLYIRIPT